MLSERIKALRNEKGISQTVLANQTTEKYVIDNIMERKNKYHKVINDIFL